MNKPINMVDPAGEYASLKNEIDTAVARVFASGRFVLGPEGEALEREICQYVGAAHAVGCNSGTDALHFPLVAAGIGAGDEVVIPGFTFFATGEAVIFDYDDVTHRRKGYRVEGPNVRSEDHTSAPEPAAGLGSSRDQASTRGAALFKHSCHSSAGTEPAVIPAPTPNDNR